MENEINVILNNSFNKIRKYTKYRGYKENIPKIKEILEELELKIITKFFIKDNPFKNLPFKIKFDILKYIKIRVSKDCNPESISNSNKKLIFKSLIIEKGNTFIPDGAYYLKCNKWHSLLYKQKDLRFIDIQINNIKELEMLSKLKTLTGCNFSFKFEINNDCVKLLNHFTQLNYLYIKGHGTPNELINIENLIEFESNFVYIKIIKIKRLKYSHIHVQNDHLINIINNDNLNKVEFVQCVLPSNILGIFDTKIKCLKIVDCKSEFDYTLKKNFFIEKIYIKNFEFSIRNIKLMKERFKLILQRSLKNVNSINFYFDFG